MVKRIEKIFSDVTGLKNLNFTEKTRINKGFNVSSLTMIQLVCAIEDEFDVEIPNSVVKKIKTVGDIVKFLEDNID
ncbi:MAG: acyl carrier protein [Clostridia bacterium]|nr:acyl carrier protein [Clostridia bacterium]